MKTSMKKMNGYATVPKYLASALLAGALLGGVNVAGAAEYWLCAGTTTKTLPGSPAPAVMWGYALDDDNDLANGCGNPVQVPGPRLTVPPGDPALTVHLSNGLAQPVSIVIPGQNAVMVPVWNDGTTGPRPPGNTTLRVRSLTHETAPGGTATYTWGSAAQPFKPGTYGYHSGTHPAVQVQMGLYGAVTKDAVAGEAYAGVPYDNEVLLLFGEIDPVIHDAVATDNYGPGKAVTSTIDYDPKYFLVNGDPFTGTATPLPGGNTAKRTLVRLINMGLETHAPVLLGAHMSLVAEDGKPYPYAAEQYSVTLDAIKTKDAVFVPSTAGVYPVFDRRLNLTNAQQPDGGMLAYLEVTSVAGAPAAADDAYSTSEDVALNVAAPGVLSNDTDPDSDPLTAVLAGSVSNGTLTLNADGSFDYVPAADFNGTAVFTYKANDGTADSSIATVSITVTPVNDAPVGTADSYSVDAGKPLNVAAPGVLGNDSDVDGDTITAVPDTGPANGALTLNADGSFTYQPNAGFSGTDSFTYTVSDNVLSSAPVTVTITVNAVANQPPVAMDDSASTTRNTSIIINVIANDSDPDGTIDPGSVTIVTGPNRGGSVVVNTGAQAGTVTYTPRRNFRGTEIFTYTVNDNSGATSNEAKVTVNVTR